MNKTLIIAKKEFKDIKRSRIFAYVLLMLFALTIISLFVSELIFRDQVTQYNNSLAILKSMGKLPAAASPQLFPLNLLRGVVGYIEIIGAILGIFLGYISVFKERNTRAIKLLLTRPVKRSSIIYGKILGNFAFVFFAIASVALLILLTLPFIGGAGLTGIDFVKLGIFTVLSSLYILIFFTLSFILSIKQKSIVNALIISFAIWLVFVLIMPQIGDTMDPDNQVPGGFFMSMALSRPQEKKVMAHFNHYETIRGGVEQLSVTKHYERSIFALFGIKKDYNGQALNAILRDQWGNIAVVVLFLLIGVWADIIFFRRSQNLLNS